LQLDEQARAAGETEKGLKEEVGHQSCSLDCFSAVCYIERLCLQVARLQKELVQAEAATAHRVREATEAERKRAEADLETFINTRSRLESELAEAEQQKIKIEKSLSERKQDGGAAASKDEKVVITLLACLAALVV
jgi:DNA gyrase/topoisomerase IV subunit A